MTTATFLPLHLEYYNIMSDSDMNEEDIFSENFRDDVCLPVSLYHVSSARVVVFVVTPGLVDEQLSALDAFWKV